MTDIFISYQQDDRAKAKVLAEIFTKLGYDVWWDVLLLPGQHFADEIKTIINDSKIVIVLWTEKAINSLWVKSEATLALEKGLLYPVWLEKVDLPLPFNNLHTHDLSGWNENIQDYKLEELISGLQDILGIPESHNNEATNEAVEDLLIKPAHEVEFWKSVCSSLPPSVNEYRTYLSRYGSNGAFSELAHLRIEQIETKGSKLKLGNKIKNILAIGSVAVGILVGLFKIGDMLGWLPNRDNTKPISTTSNYSWTEIETRKVRIIKGNCSGIKYGEATCNETMLGKQVAISTKYDRSIEVKHIGGELGYGTGIKYFISPDKTKLTWDGGGYCGGDDYFSSTIAKVYECSEIPGN